MEQQYELVDRNVDGIGDTNSSETKGVIEKIKLTEQSENNMDASYSKVIMKNENDVKEETNTTIVEETRDNQDDSNYNMVGFKPSYLKNSERAIKFAEEMVNNTKKSYDKSIPEVKVEGVDSERMMNTVESGFDFYNINQEENKDAETTVDAEESIEYEPFEINDEVQENSALDNLVDESESDVQLNNTESTEDSILSDSVESSIIPEIRNYFAENKLDDSINEGAISENIGEEAMLESDLYSKISDSLDNEDNIVTIDDLNELRQALQNERNRKNQLTRELEQKQFAQAEAEREMEEAERTKQEKIQLVNEELAAYRKENDDLKTQTMQIEEQTKEQISKRRDAMNYISLLDQMMTDTSSYSNSSSEKGARKAA